LGNAVGPIVTNIEAAVSSAQTLQLPSARRASMFYGGGGLLLILGIVLLVLGFTLIGIICIVLALATGGFGMSRSRRA
jgi:hypothetical protein